MFRSSFTPHSAVGPLTNGYRHGVEVEIVEQPKHAKVYRLVTWKPIGDASNGYSSGPDHRRDLHGNTCKGRYVRRTLACAECSRSGAGRASSGSRTA
jgi:hypothetical protein